MRVGVDIVEVERVESADIERGAVCQPGFHGARNSLL